MRLSAPEEYGIRCLIRLARHRAEAPLPLSEIADAEGLSPENAAKILSLLRRGGLVESVRGARGGYRLGRPASEIRIWDLLTFLDGPLYTDAWCESHSGQLANCANTTDCSLRALLKWIDDALRKVLSELTLADLAGTEGRAKQVLVDIQRLNVDEVTT